MSTLLDLPSKRKLRINADDDIARRVDMINKLVLVRDGKVSLSDDVYSAADIHMLIDLYCASYALHGICHGPVSVSVCHKSVFY